MKGIYIFSVGLMFFSMVMFPLFSMEKTVVPNSPGQEGKEETVRIYMSDEEKIEEVSLFQYICGVVGAEVPAENHKETLKAQAVAAYTYYLNKKGQSNNKDYDITDSPKTDQAYISDSAAKTLWKNNYDAYTKKITEAVGEVFLEYIAFEDKPILAVYHNISGGRTESAENVWGKAYPYLVPVESVGDVLSSNYLSKATIAEDKLKKKLQSVDITVPEALEPGDWFSDIKRSESGTVLTASVCGTQVSGTKLRSLLGLKSANLEVAYSDEKFTFTVKGHGHLVGMSQCGAEFMANQGSTYKEILLWYYKGCEIKKA